MKYVLVIGSGMADIKLPQLAKHTPMEVLALNAFDRVAGCSLGRVLTVPHGVAVNSANAVMSILGYDPKACEADASLTPFAEMFGCEGSFICADSAVQQIARRAGLKTPEVAGANGAFDTNYEGKAYAALDALANGDDFAAVHVAAPDQMAREGDLARKLEAVQNVEYRVVMILLNQLMGRGEDFRLMLLSDHATLLPTQAPMGGPVPYAIFDSRTVRKALDEGKEPPTRKFSEEESSFEPVLMDGTELMKILFARG